MFNPIFLTNQLFILDLHGKYTLRRKQLPTAIKIKNVFGIKKNRNSYFPNPAATQIRKRRKVEYAGIVGGSRCCLNIPGYGQKRSESYP